MANVVTVTPAQVAAAKFLIERAEKAGKPVDPAIRAIADAKRPTTERAAS